MVPLLTRGEELPVTGTRSPGTLGTGFHATLLRMMIKIETNLRNSDGSLGTEERAVSRFQINDGGVLEVTEANGTSKFYGPAYWLTVQPLD